jgi:hypothetical protein
MCTLLKNSASENVSGTCAVVTNLSAPSVRQETTREAIVTGVPRLALWWPFVALWRLAKHRARHPRLPQV